MKCLEWASLSATERKESLARPEGAKDLEFKSKVEAIGKKIRKEGDQALREYTKKFDQVEIGKIRVAEEEIYSSEKRISQEVKEAIDIAADRIQRFHFLDIPKGFEVTDSWNIRCEKKFVAIDTIGFYVPGGSAPLVSSVLMQGIPSKIAGNPRRILVTPPSREVLPHPALLYAAKVSGISECYAAGGAQAIFALAYGTESIPKVDKIFGPGNSWVTEAKLQVSQDPFGAAIDFPAGPSEVLVIADELSDARTVASDLLSQCEHGADSQCVLISPSREVIEKVKTEVTLQVKTLPRREIAEKSLECARFIQCKNIEEAIEISNLYAPEHLILQIERASFWVSKIRNAGSVFLGAFSPETAGDYASGTNHVLPTYGYAKAYGGLGVSQFMKSLTIQEVSERGLRELAPTLLTLSKLEGLDAHARAVSSRFFGKEAPK